MWGKCPGCFSPSNSVVEYVERKTRDLSMSGRVVHLNFHQRRFRCRMGCPHFWERFTSIEQAAAHYTLRYEVFVWNRVNESTIEAVSKQEGLNWETIQNICRARTRPAKVY
jgi:transposase